MHTINTKDLKGNEVLAKSILSSSNMILINKGTVLKKEYINRLIQLGIKSVAIEDQVLTNEIIEKNNQIVDNINNIVKNLLEQHIYRNNNNISAMCNIAQEIIDNIVVQKEMFEYIINLKQEGTDLYAHSINVCTLSTLLALLLELDMEKVIDIAKGSLLHDIGLRYIETSYENVDVECMSEKAKKEYRKHVIYGYDAVANMNFLKSNAKKIIIHHHELFNGNGFPFKLKGDRIPIEVAIVAICDEFDKRRIGIGCIKTKNYEIIEYLKGNKYELFDPNIIDLLLSVVALYPIGSKVITNEDEVGIVVRLNKHFTERPVIAIIQDKDGNQVIPAKETDLLQVLNIYIKDVLN